MKKRSTKLKWLGLTLAGLGAVVSSGVIAAEANSMQAESRGGIKVFNPADDSFWFSVGGRLNFDETFFAGGSQDKQSDYATGGNIRRALVKLEGGVGDYLTYNLTMNFDGSNARFDTAWINACSKYTGAINQADVRFGQFTPPVSIDAWGHEGTSNDMVFLEPALATSAFSISNNPNSPNKVYGIGANVSALDMFVLSGAAYHPKQDNTDNFGNKGRSDRLGGNVRLTFVPFHTDDTVFHLGAVGRYQSLNNRTTGGAAAYQAALFSTGPEAVARNTASLVSTGSGNGTALNTGLRAKSFNVATGEALAILGPAFVETEYHHANIQRVPNILNNDTAGNPRFHGWHVEGGYMLTGESRGYDFMTGTLRNPKPANKCGAWEIAARYSYVNLNDKNIYGGSEHNTTVGVNWFVNENVRIAANYIRANIRPTGTDTINNVANVPTGLPVTTPAGGTQPVVKRQLDIFGVRFSVVF